MIEGLASAADVAENSGNAGGIEKPNFDTKEPQDFSGNDINPNNDFSGEMDLSGDNSDKTSSDILDTSQVQDYSGDDLYNSEDFASEKDGNKESEGQIKENAVAEENKPKETTEQSEPKKGDENTDTSDDNLTDEEKDLIKNATDDSETNNETENRMEPQVVISFKCPEGCDPVEYERQLKQQEEGLNNQSVAENMANREAYEKRKEETGNGRDPEGNNAQKEARDKALQDKIAEYQEQGMSYSEAEEKAQEWLGTQAALHNPDQVAGGNPSDVQGVGDSNVNSSIGSQWANKVGILKDACDSYAEGKTPEELANTKMNVKLIMEV